MGQEAVQEGRPGLMPWFRVDDQLATHPKVIRVGNAAMGLWVRAGSWAMQQLTDGFVPDSVVKMLDGKPTQTKALVDAGLWVKARGGYQFHGWEEFQVTRAKVKDERVAAAERKRRSRRDSRVTDGGMSRVSHTSPTLPYPTGPLEEASEGELTGDCGEVGPPDKPVFIDHCERHRHVPTPGPCGPCADVRKAQVRLSLVATPCLVHAEPDVKTCRGCAADAKAAPGS